MGRAIVRSPQVFLMDEPLSNLDAKLRVQTRTQIASLQRRLGVTTVYVTHDQVEAMTMGDRVAVLKDGLLQQLDTPRRLYDHPNNVFVAGFIGSPAMNLLEVPVTEAGIKLGSLVHPVDRATLAKTETTVTVGIRPEDLVPAAEGGIPVEIDVVEAHHLRRAVRREATRRLQGREADRGSRRRPPGPRQGTDPSLRTQGRRRAPAPLPPQDRRAHRVLTRMAG
jgi:ABC-type sugar transport system ATPase subunit